MNSEQKDAVIAAIKARLLQGPPPPISDEAKKAFREGKARRVV